MITQPEFFLIKPKIYIERCEEFIKTPPKEFDGIFEHKTKA